MAIRRAMAVVVALVVSATFAVAQQAPKQDDKKRNKQEEAEAKQLVTFVDGAMEGKAPASAVTMSFEPYFMKAQDQRTYVPFVLKVSGQPKTDTALMVRVVPQPTAAATTAPATQKPPQKDKGGRVYYPWEDLQFIAAAEMQPDALTLTRVFMAAPGTYDVYVALKERLPEKAPKSQIATIGWVKHTVTVPDFHSGELATSTVIASDKVNTLSAPLTPDEMRVRPFAFGAQELVPAEDLEFKKDDELSLFFQIYNSGLDSAGKPDLTMEYEFFRIEGSAEKFFNRTPPQNLNATNLPPQFDPAKFPIPGGVSVPLKSFAEGPYRLAIKIHDKAANKTINREVKFTIKG